MVSDLNAAYVIDHVRVIAHTHTVHIHIHAHTILLRRGVLFIVTKWDLSK